MADNTVNKPEKQSEKKPGFIEKVKKLVKDYKREFKKITWPTVADTNKSFVLVLAATVVVGVAIFALDLGLNALFNLLG